MTYFGIKTELIIPEGIPILQNTGYLSVKTMPSSLYIGVF